MKHSIILLAIALLVTLSSCEQTVELGEVPYLEKIVVDGMITSGEPIKVTFSKTMPPTTSLDSWRGFDTAAIRLTNVVATITVDNQVCTLQHIRVGEYFARKPNGDTLYCEIGKTYILNAQWNGHTISATTTAPTTKSIQLLPLMVDSTNSRPQENYVLLLLSLPIQYELNKNELLTNTLILQTKGVTKPQYIIQETDSLFKGWEYFSTFPLYRLTYSTNETKKGYFSAVIEGYFGKYSGSAFQYYDSVFIETITYDWQFLDYINTEWNNNGDGDFFGASGSNVKWNVKGDGLGLFLAKTTHKTPIVFK